MYLFIFIVSTIPYFGLTIKSKNDIIYSLYKKEDSNMSSGNKKIIINDPITTFCTIGGVIALIILFTCAVLNIG